MDYIVNEELEQILSSFEFEEYGFDRLDSFAASEDSMELQFIVAILDGRKDKQRWRVTATDVLDAALHPNDSGLEFSVTHPILRRYTEPAARLSIRGKPDDPLALILALSSPRRPNKHRDTRSTSSPPATESSRNVLNRVSKKSLECSSTTVSKLT